MSTPTRLLTVQNQKRGSKRASFVLDTTEVDDLYYTTEFTFLDWPIDIEGIATRICISSPHKSWCSDGTITLTYIDDVSGHIILQAKTGDIKAMSIVTSETTSIINIIDALMNQYFTDDPNDNLPRYRLSDTTKLYPDKSKLPMDYISWGIILYEKITVINYSIRIDKPADLPGSPIHYFKLV